MELELLLGTEMRCLQDSVLLGEKHIADRHEIRVWGWHSRQDTEEGGIAERLQTYDCGKDPRQNSLMRRGTCDVLQ